MTVVNDSRVQTGSGAGSAARPASASARPVVGLAGFFGYGNYGDELFLDVFRQHLGDDFELRILTDQLRKPYFSRPVEEMVAEVDAVLIGGGDLVQPWAVDPRYFNTAYLKRPVFIAGVGVPIRAKTSDREVESAAAIARAARFFQNENVRFINARDNQSAEWIRKKLEPKVPVVESPDLVCALDLPKATPASASDPVLGIVTRLRPGHEEDDDYTQLAHLAAHVKALGWRVRHIVLGNGEVGERDVKNAERLVIPGKEVFYSESLDDMSRAIGECTALASMKFHGSVVATMYGVPSTVLIPTSKNRNFMRRMGRDDLLCKFDSPELVNRFTPPPAPIDPNWVRTLREDASAMLRQLKAAIHEAVAARPR
ncbi:polysaccharide pyruvyl transferase family protein [Falsiroseomonas sp.]|uniref:polysaccharide pyruvyl transferase family protein n=1 Tax=Falsiroseomonas sp. TaxID=2870721 RepID=UPI003F70919A